MPSRYGNRQKHENPNPVQRALIGRFYRELAGVVHRIGPRDILDVGCGEGYTFKALRSAGISCSMHGVDLSDEAIELARERVADATFEVGDALRIAESDRTYDLVLMTEVLEHLPDPGRMLPVLERVAERYVVASVPWEPFFRWLNFLRGKHLLALGNDPEHVNRWNRRAFLDFMARRFVVRQAPMVFPWTLVAVEKTSPR